jgi:hypothetical protein
MHPRNQVFHSFCVDAGRLPDATSLYNLGHASLATTTIYTTGVVTRLAAIPLVTDHAGTVNYYRLQLNVAYSY